jgi:hypothetical protein
VPARPGDRVVLVSDGVWGVLSPAAFVRAIERLPAREAAENLVAEALALGGPDNATAVVVDVVPGDPAVLTERDLPRDERPDDRRLWPRPASLRPPLWPWPLLVVGVALLVHQTVHWLGIDVDFAALWPFGR